LQPTLESAWELLRKYNKGEFHLNHAKTVGDVMMYFADRLGYGDEREFWGVVGLLHDIDYEMYPDRHCVAAQEILREHGVDERIIRAVASHGWGIACDIPSLLERPEARERGVARAPGCRLRKFRVQVEHNRTLARRGRHPFPVKLPDVAIRDILRIVDAHVPLQRQIERDVRLDLEALERADHPNLFLQFDFYHIAITEPDLVSAIRRAGPIIGHVQFADTPGRNEPGTGSIDFASAMAALKETGYQGAVSAEYRPKGETMAGLGWMRDFREMME